MNELGIRYDRNNNLIINGFYDFTITVKDELCNTLISYNYFENLNLNGLFRVFYFPKPNQLIISTSKNGLFNVSCDLQKINGILHS